MNSMTGFGRGRARWGTATIEFTLSCVNKRGLEISVSLPRELAGLEVEFNEMIRKNFERGKMQLTGRLDSSAAAGTNLKKRFDELKKSCQALKVPFNPDASLVCQIMSASGAGCGESPAKMTSAAKAAAEEAIEACIKAQAAEGKRLEKDFHARLNALRELVAKAEELSLGSIAAQRERLLKNLGDAGLNINPNDERILKELALFADRVDIAEEITRIKSHLEAAEALLKKAPIGRQLEFLLQELLREWNTLGNKSQILSLVQLALEAKNEVERLREQAANIA